jgi:hypothetical protein
MSMQQQSSAGGPAAVLPAAQELPVFGRRRAQDRLQGCQAAAAVHLRARQDRAEPHHGGFGQAAARTGSRHQAGTISGASALCGEVETAPKRALRAEVGAAGPPLTRSTTGTAKRWQTGLQSGFAPALPRRCCRQRSSIPRRSPWRCSIFRRCRCSSPPSAGASARRRWRGFRAVSPSPAVAGAQPAFAFLIGVAVPPAILSPGSPCAAGRPATRPRLKANPSLHGLQWYPEGRLVLWAAALAAGLTSLVILLIAPSVESLRAILEDLVTQMFAALGDEIEMRAARQMVNVMTVLLPVVAASIWLLATLVNMKLGARLLRLSAAAPGPGRASGRSPSRAARCGCCLWRLPRACCLACWALSARCSRRPSSPPLHLPGLRCCTG